MTGSHRGARRLAAVFWLAAGGVYLATEGLAATAFTPAYDYAQNYISDLGVPTCGLAFEGRAICSPWHDLMNAGFIIQGLLFVAAAAVAARSVKGLARYALVGLAAINCIGIALVGVFHEATALGSETLKYHVLGAFLAIVAGNAAALPARALAAQLGLPAFYRSASLVLPILGFIGLAMLIVAQARGTTLVPDAVWERLSVYTITAWELLTGTCLLMVGRKTLIPTHRSA